MRAELSSNLGDWQFTADVIASRVDWSAAEEASISPSPSPVSPVGMATAYNLTAHRPREWRRRVSMPARVQHGGQWASGQILNLSSRGMLIHYSRPLRVGTRIEVRQGSYAVTATVVWQRGGRAGLHCSSGIGIVDWLESAAENGLAEAPKGDAPPVERRRSTRIPDCARETGRKIEFAVIAGGMAAAALSLAAGAAATLAVPLHEVAVALGR